MAFPLELHPPGHPAHPQEHMSTAGGKCLYAEIGRSGTGGAAYATNSEAAAAQAALNGSSFEGVTLQCEMWGAMWQQWQIGWQIQWLWW